MHCCAPPGIAARPGRSGHEACSPVAGFLCCVWINVRQGSDAQTAPANPRKTCFTWRPGRATTRGDGRGRPCVERLFHPCAARRQQTARARREHDVDPRRLRVEHAHSGGQNESETSQTDGPRAPTLPRIPRDAGTGGPGGTRRRDVSWRRCRRRRTHCASLVIVGHYYLMTVPAWQCRGEPGHSSDPTHPREGAACHSVLTTSRTLISSRPTSGASWSPGPKACTLNSRQSECTRSRSAGVAFYDQS